MRELYCVKPWREIDFTGASLKLEALLFDRIVFTYTDIFSDLEFSKEEFLQRFALLPWLFEKGIVATCSTNPNDYDETESIWPIVTELSRMICQSAQPADTDLSDEEKVVRRAKELLTSPDEVTRQELLRQLGPYMTQYRFCIEQLSEFSARITSAKLRKQFDLEAYPLVRAISPPAVPEGASKSQIVQILLKALPVPDDTVSWEEILDYRSDPNSLKKFRALRNWMNELTRSSLSPHEIEDKLDYLMHEYRQHLELHRLKTKVGLFEMFVVTTAETVENLVKLNWGMIAKTLFALKHRQLELFECELTAPGREVAYVVKTQDTFLASHH